MKTTKLTCNVCRAVEEIEHEPHAHGVSKPGWFHVLVSEHRAPAPRHKGFDMATAMARFAHQMPDELRTLFEQFAEEAKRSEAEAEAFQMPPEPVQRAADLCPDCGPKILGNVMPHVVGESRRHGMLIGGY